MHTHQLWEVDEDFKPVRLLKEETTDSKTKPEGFTKDYHRLAGDYYESNTDSDFIVLYKTR